MTVVRDDDDDEQLNRNHYIGSLGDLDWYVSVCVEDQRFVHNFVNMSKDISAVFEEIYVSEFQRFTIRCLKKILR